MRYILALLSLFIVPELKGSAIVVSGTIASSTTWLADTVKVTGNLIIDPGVILTINSGTRVEVSNNVHIEIQGQVKANGTVNDTVYFYALPGSLWRGIHIINPSTFTDSTLFEYCSFVNSRSMSLDGGAFYLQNAKQVIFRQCLFKENWSPTGGGGAIYMMDSNPLIEDCTFTDNTASGHGGAIFIESSQNLSLNSVPLIRNCLFTGNDASNSYGGAIYGFRGSMDYTIENCVFKDNLGGRGGALTFINTDPIIQNNTLSNNTADQHEGGAIWLGNSDALISGNRIDSNYAFSSSFQSRGGGVYIRFSNVDLLNNTVKGNESGYGGGISLDIGSTADIEGNILDSNTANLFGSAVYGAGGFGGSSTMRIDSNLIINNGGYLFSHALFAAGSSTSMKVTRNIIEYNERGGIGYGPTYFANQLSEVHDNMIRYNGRVGITAAYVDIFNNEISHNGSVGILARAEVNIAENEISHNGGSGIEVDNGNADLIIQFNRIFWNIDSSHAGGIELSNSDVEIINNEIRNNYGRDGGGIGINNSDPRIVGNLISNNSGVDGGGVYIYDDSSNPEFINNTIVNNDASAKGGGVYHHAQSLMDFTNTILWGNHAGSAPNQMYIHYDNQDPDFYNCNIEGGAAAFDLNFGFFSGTYQDNLDTMPSFTSAALGIGNTIDSLRLSKWTLNKNSPLIDMGTDDTTGLSLPIVDIDSTARIKNDTIDIGAYERPSPLLLTSFPSFYSICEDDAVTFSVTSNLSPVRFLWYKNNLLLQDSAISSFTIAQASLQDSGFYILTAVTDSDTLTDSLYLQIYARPILSTLGVDTGFCSGFSLTLNAQAGFTAYQWSNNLQSPSVSITQPGAYYYEVTDSNGCTGYSDTIMINEFSNYNFSLGPDQLICESDSLLIGSVISGANYLWSTTDTSASIYALNPGTYWVQLTDTNGCIKTDTLNIVSDTLKTNLPDSLIITSNGVFQLGIPSYFNAIQWNTGSNQDSITIDPQQSLLPYYSVSAINSNGCLINDTVYIINLIGINEWKNSNEFQVYPNPSKGTFYVKKPYSSTGNMEVEIRDLSGKKIKAMITEHGSEIRIDLDAGPGTYLLSIYQSKIKRSYLLINGY